MITGQVHDYGHFFFPMSSHVQKSFIIKLDMFVIYHRDWILLSSLTISEFCFEIKLNFNLSSQMVIFMLLYPFQS